MTKTESVLNDPTIKEENREKIRLYLGTANGKTTATFGVIMRALSTGKNVSITFFDKLEENSSEGKALRVLAKHQEDGFGRLTVNYTGVNRLGTGPKGSFRFYSAPNGILPEDKVAALEGLGYITEALKRKDDIVIGDELLDVARVGLIEWDAVKDAFALRDAHTVLILTGRKAPDWLMKEATTISTTTQLKHHGRAIEGLDC